MQEDPHKAFRQLGTYLEKLRGPNGVPMACIIRDSLIVERWDEDETEYPTMDDEMIERFPLLASDWDSYGRWPTKRHAIAQKST